jgi:hypothetical protein
MADDKDPPLGKVVQLFPDHDTKPRAPISPVSAAPFPFDFLNWHGLRISLSAGGRVFISNAAAPDSNEGRVWSHFVHALHLRLDDMKYAHEMHTVDDPDAPMTCKMPFTIVFTLGLQNSTDTLVFT